MTSPVITSEKIAMTSPVLSNTESMSFVLPPEYTMETAPEPKDIRVSINEIPEKYVATVRFRGFAWKQSVAKQTQRLLDWLDRNEIKYSGKTFLMQYNPPYTPSFLRRNEIGIKVEYQE